LLASRICQPALSIENIAASQAQCPQTSVGNPSIAAKRAVKDAHPARAAGAVNAAFSGGRSLLRAKQADRRRRRSDETIFRSLRSRPETITS
jgi:hypothetical protein